MYILSTIPFTKIPRPALQTLDYFSTKKISVGGIVEISLRKRKILAVVVSCSPVLKQKQQIKKSSFSLKPVERIISDKRIIPKDYLVLILWISDYFYAPLGLVAKSILPQLFSRPTKKFIEELHGSDLCSYTGQTRVVRLKHSKKPILYWSKRSDKAKISLYSSEIKKALKKKQKILFLVPEIYKIEYFQKKIATLRNAIAVHSGLTPKIQYDVWKKALSGKIEIVIGARSALSMPLRNLGLIIIDEEESYLYKSFDQQPYINAKDIAIKLAELTCAKVLLGSDMPSIESFWKAKKGEYELKMPARRSLGEGGSNVRVIDMREELKCGNYSIFSRELQTKLLNTIRGKKQAILFINRRGLSTGLVCRDCGHMTKCPNCDVQMVFHEANSQLICHHCGQKQKPPTLCPECKSYKIKFVGAGTQRVEQELRRLFFKNKISDKFYKIARIDSDIAPKWEQQKETLKGFRGEKYNILIGTQLMLKKIMIPKVNLVSVITTDPLLSLPDFRINEQVYRIIDKLQTLSMSTILLQTYIVDNDVVKNIRADAYTFFKNEFGDRKELSLPPFSQIIKLVYSHKDPQRAEQEANLLKNRLETQLSNFPPETNQPLAGVRISPRSSDGATRRMTGSDFSILGPAPAFIPRVKNSYIWQIMIKSKIKETALRNKLLRIVPSDWKIDVDPVEML